MGCEESNLFKCSRSHDHAHIWWKTSRIFFFGTKRPMTLKHCIQHRVLMYYQCFHTITLGSPWPFLWQGQTCFRMLLHGWKLIQHWVLMYFQVCSNSAYPQHSGKRYRTNDPLVLHYFRVGWQRLRKIFSKPMMSPWQSKYILIRPKNSCVSTNPIDPTFWGRFCHFYCHFGKNKTVYSPTNPFFFKKTLDQI